MLFHQVSLVLYIKRVLIFLFISLMPWLLSAQGISNLWMMGYSSGTMYPYFGGTNINFYSGFPDTSHINRSMNFDDCNANISDQNGNLLFYTNGVYISNANNDTMLNGDNLNPSAYTTQNAFAGYGLRVRQGNLIIPLPGSSNIYYLFHETIYSLTSFNSYRSLEMFYSIIDMSLDGGLGAVVQKNVVLLTDTLTIGGITACKHANGRDWWIVFHKATGKTYYKYLLTPSGLQGPFQQDIGYDFPRNDFIWQSCFSPDGKKFSSVMAQDTFDVMDFDRCSGLFSNAVSICIKDSAAGRGVAFSPNSEFLYVSSMNYVYQFNANSTNIDSSKILLARYDGFADFISLFRTSFYLAHIANDGKIYINSGNGTRWLHVINNPNEGGFACNLVQHGLLLPTFNSFTIPNFPNYFLGADLGSVCDSLLPENIYEYKNNEINIFPNPANNILYVSNLSKGLNGEIKISNSFGEIVLVQKQTINNSEYIEFNVSTLTSGIYFIETINEKESVVKRFVKN